MCDKLKSIADFICRNLLELNKNSDKMTQTEMFGRGFSENLACSLIEIFLPKVTPISFEEWKDFTRVAEVYYDLESYLKTLGLHKAPNFQA